MLKKALLIVYLLSTAFLHGAVGKRASVTKVSWPQVMHRVVKEMNKYDKHQLYYILNQADREKGAKKTFKVLLDSACEMIATLPESKEKSDFFGLGVLFINLGLINQAIVLREEGDSESANALFEEIEELQEALFSFLQLAANDGQCSPRGSSDVIKRGKGEMKKSPTPLTLDLIKRERNEMKKSPTPLTKELIIEE